jgi:AmiR/NasT family two-component response regulator
MTDVATKNGGIRVLIVEDDTLVGMGLRGQLQKLGHSVVGQAADAAEARAMFRAHEPQLVLLDIRLGDDDGIDLARDLLRTRRCPMIIVSAFAEKELIARATEAGVFGYLTKPVDGRMLAAQIEVAGGRFKEAEALRAETAKLSQDLKTRKVMDRAKGILMKRAQLSEEEAHRRLQMESQKRRIGMAELCQRIIESEEMMGK